MLSTLFSVNPQSYYSIDFKIIKLFIKLSI